jgi:hypothetical protein
MGGNHDIVLTILINACSIILGDDQQPKIPGKKSQQQSLPRHKVKSWDKQQRYVIKLVLQVLNRDWFLNNEWGSNH